VWDVCCCGVCSVNACMLICCHCLSALDSNDTKSTEEGKIFEYQEEDQGQAKKGKPSKILAYLILILLIACFIMFMKMHGFILLLPLNSNY
jgi:hypothetical protein